ncbi:MAG: hypothetical protein AAF571_10880, partial [Verrucomicrobiota bacterium]
MAAIVLLMNFRLLRSFFYILFIPVCANLCRAEIDNILLGKTTPDELQEKFEEISGSTSSGVSEDVTYLEKNYTIRVFFNKNGVYAFQAHGKIKLSDIDQFIAANDHLGPWPELSRETDVERNLIDEEQFEMGRFYEEGKAGDVIIFRKAASDENFILEYWLKSQSSTKAVFVCVYMRDLMETMHLVTDETHRFYQIEGNALLSDWGEKYSLDIKESSSGNRRGTRRGSGIPSRPEANGFQFILADEPYVVNYIGYFDFRNDGLAVDHVISIWDQDKNKIFEETVPAGDDTALNGNFRWVKLKAPFTLEPANTYYLVGSTHRE